VDPYPSGNSIIRVSGIHCCRLYATQSKWELKWGTCWDYWGRATSDCNKTYSVDKSEQVPTSSSQKRWSHSADHIKSSSSRTKKLNLTHLYRAGGVWTKRFPEAATPITWLHNASWLEINVLAVRWPLLLESIFLCDFSWKRYLKM